MSQHCQSARFHLAPMSLSQDAVQKPAWGGRSRFYRSIAWWQTGTSNLTASHALLSGMQPLQTIAIRVASQGFARRHTSGEHSIKADWPKSAFKDRCAVKVGKAMLWKMRNRQDKICGGGYLLSVTSLKTCRALRVWRTRAMSLPAHERNEPVFNFKLNSISVHAKCLFVDNT